LPIFKKVFNNFFLKKFKIKPSKINKINQCKLLFKKFKQNKKT